MEVEERVLRAEPERAVEPRLGLGAPSLRARAPSRPRRRRRSTAARHGRGARDAPFPPAGCGGRPGRRRSRGRRVGRSRPAPGRWPRRSLAGAPPPSSGLADRAGRRATRRTAGAGRRSPPAALWRQRRRACLERRRPGPAARARGRIRGRSVRAARTCSRGCVDPSPSPSASFASSTCAHAVGSGTPPAASRARFIAAAAPRRSPRQLTRVGDTGVGGEARLHGRHPIERRECLRVAPELDQRVTHHAVGPRRERRTATCIATEDERAAKVVPDQGQVAEPQRRRRVPRPCVECSPECALGEGQERRDRPSRASAAGRRGRAPRGGRRRAGRHAPRARAS